MCPMAIFCYILVCGAMHTSRAPNLLLKIFPPRKVAKVASCQEMDIVHQHLGHSYPSLAPLPTPRDESQVARVGNARKILITHYPEHYVTSYGRVVT